MDKNTKQLMFSHKNDEWSTPQSFFDQINNIFNFTLDPCATDLNAKCKKYYTILDDGLSKSWQDEVVFVNPPYSKNKEWIKKCYEESIKHDITVAVLIPVRSDTKYWHQYCMKASEIFFIEGRLKFGDMKNSAPFPSALVVFKGKTNYNPVIYSMKRD